MIYIAVQDQILESTTAEHLLKLRYTTCSTSSRVGHQLSTKALRPRIMAVPFSWCVSWHTQKSMPIFRLVNRSMMDQFRQQNSADHRGPNAMSESSLSLSWFLNSSMLILAKSTAVSASCRITVCVHETACQKLMHESGWKPSSGLASLYLFSSTYCG